MLRVGTGEDEGDSRSVRVGLAVTEAVKESLGERVNVCVWLPPLKGLFDRLLLGVQLSVGVREWLPVSETDGESDNVGVSLVVSGVVSLEVGVVEVVSERVNVDVERGSVRVGVGVTVHVTLCENDGL